MSDVTNVEVRTVAREDQDGVFEFTARVVGGGVRTGLNVASVPLVLLPKEPRRRVRRAMGEVALAIVSLSKDIGRFSERVVDEIYAEGQPEMPNMPRPEAIGERARDFTKRMSRAAEEFTSSFTGASRRAGDSVERAAARVDEWVEKP